MNWEEECRALRQEVQELRADLSIAQGCAALSGIGVDAYKAVLETAKHMTAKLIAAEAEIERLRKLLREAP